MTDSLNQEQGSYWASSSDAESSCSFSGGEYHVKVATYELSRPCQAHTEDLSNFAFQVTVRFVQGDQSDVGGIIFRAQVDQTGNINGARDYYFSISRQRDYALGVNTGPALGKRLATGISSAINTQSNQTNLLTIIALGKNIYAYINKQLVASVTDSSFKSGQLYLYALDFYNPVDLAFSNAQIWKL